jgi:hypothetical protein
VAAGSTLVELCSCEPGCDCNFRGVPNSEAGNCEAFVCYAAERGHFDAVDLAGVTFVWALWWPGAIHDKGGRGSAYVDCETEDQFGAMRTIIRGEAGYAFFEIFNSTFDEPSAVERATVALNLGGKASSFSVEGVGSARMEPLRNPVTGEENEVRIVKPGGFIWKDGRIGQSGELTVALPGIAFEHGAGRHAVIAPFDWAA